MRMRALARLVAMAGIMAIGWFLLGARPRDVVLAYDVSSAPDATALEVEIRRGGELVRHAELRLGHGEQPRHTVRLREATYVLAWRLDRPGGAVRGERELVVTGDETIVLPLGP